VLPVFLLLLAQSDPGFPIYSSGSIANSAANVSGSYAPNTLISIYGVNLAYSTTSVAVSDIREGNLPTSLGSAPVRVLLNGQFASLFYVSPYQVNALIPPQLLPGQVTIQVLLSNRAGPPVVLTLDESAPGLFETDDHFVIATHGNGPLVTAEAPAAPGEVVVLYATGLGPTFPQTPPNKIANAPAKLTSQIQVWLNGIPVSKERILYAGVTPGFAGLFQINLQLLADLSPNPEIRVGGDHISPAGRFLRTR
jgi:uncharacterized protein (TIGR03437 family)